jgi:capsular polysaccharide transport system permease protein
MDAQSEAYRIEIEEAEARTPWYRTRRAVFAAVVLLPTLLVFLYTALIASPEYESRAEFIIKGMDKDKPPVGGIAELVGAGSELDSAAREAEAVQDYMLSLEAIGDLKQRGVNVDSLLYGPHADPLASLYHSDRRAEGVRDYYRSMVDVDYDSGEGITRLAARAYTPQEAKKLAAALMALGEAQINTYNQRAIAAGQELARQQLTEAEDELASVQGQMTAFRDISGDLDPSAKGKASEEELESTQADLTLEQSNLASMRRHLSASSPLVQAAQSRVATLQSAVGRMQARLAGDADALTRRLSEYEKLKLKQEFAAKRYDAARSRLEEAQTEAAEQRLFLVPVVVANLPEKPVAPTPFRTTLIVFLGLCLAFAIGWLILAGIREHHAD